MRTPWHLWVVGSVALLWNAGGAYDYLMTQLDNQDYLSMLNPAQRAFMAARPVWFDAVWFDAVWAIGVWFAVAGSVLILLRSRFAAPAFLISLAVLLGSAVWSYGIARPSALEVMGSISVWLSLLICATLIGFWAYSRAMTLRGVLR